MKTVSMKSLGLLAGAGVVVWGAAGWFGPAGVPSGAGVAMAQVGPAADRPAVKTTEKPVRDLVSYRDVVKRVLPAVVSIESRGKPVTTRMMRPEGSLTPFDDPGIPEAMRKQLERMMPGVRPGPGGRPGFNPEEQPGDRMMGSGSGFLIDAAGVVLTNAHVVEGASEVMVLLEDGRKVVSKDIKSDPKTDLAIVRLDSAKGPYPFIELGDSDQMEIGDRVLAVGAPFGMAGTVTHGIISAKNRSLDVNLYEDFLQTDAAINPGNSGGPLVNVEGQVIGINSAIRSRSGGFQGIGLAIPSNLARSVKDQLVRHGTVRRGYLGVSVQSVANPDLAAKLGLKDGKGALVTAVMPKAPAGNAGIQAGDVILSVGGKLVKDGKSLQAAVTSSSVGSEVPVVVLRDGASQTLSVKLEEQPAGFGLSRGGPPNTEEEEEPSADAANGGALGMKVAELTAANARQAGFSQGVRGVLVTQVERGSAAEQAGIRPGLLLTHVEKKVVSGLDSFTRVTAGLTSGQQVLLQLRTPEGNALFLVVKN